MMSVLPDLNLSTCQERHWPAKLSLGFRHLSDKTRLSQMNFYGPLRVQRPFYPEAEVCHVYLLHPPGGLVSGDDLLIEMQGAADSHALITTPSAGKIYQADSQQQIQKQQVNLHLENSVMEWLPMETIVFDGAHGRLETCVQLHGDARFIGIDVFCLGRPKSGLPFRSGSIEQRLAIYQDCTPVLLERQLITADDPLVSAICGFNGHLVSGTMVVCGLKDPEPALALVREAFPDVPGTISITNRLGVLVIRYLGDCSEQAQQQLRHCWGLIRPLLLGKPACQPRIWHT